MKDVVEARLVGGDSLDAGAPSGFEGAVFADPGADEACLSAGPFIRPPCWAAKKHGYDLRLPAGFSGAMAVRVHAVVSRPGKIVVTDRGHQAVNLLLPPYTPPLTVRFERGGSPFCWDATFSTPARNDAARVSATSD